MAKNAAAAVALFKEGGLSCSQALLSVYGHYFGFDKETAIKLASAFGGGMGRMAETCGAVTGALMVLGLTYRIEDPEAKEKVYTKTEKFIKQFKSRNGSILCREMLGYDMGTAEGLSIIKEKHLIPTVCPKFVQDAAEITETILSESKVIPI